jgi:hypothetical protein
VTRLYFTANDVAPITPGFAGWADTSQAIRRNLSIAKLAATEVRSGTLSGVAGNNALAAQLISLPLSGAQTISGTWSAVSRGRELTATDNIVQKLRFASVVSGDGGTVRGTLVALSAGSNATELTLALAGNTHSISGGITSVNALDGDRIVVELGYGEAASGTTPQWEFALGGNGTDHANAQGDTTGTVAWVEFSTNLVFQVAQVSRLPTFNSQYMGRW